MNFLVTLTKQIEIVVDAEDLVSAKDEGEHLGYIQLMNEMCIFRTDRAHCTGFQCTPSALSVHAFRKANHAYDLLNYQDSYRKI